MPTPTITDASLRRLPAPAKPQLIGLGNALYLRHLPSGGKSFLLRRRVAGVVQVTTLGHWPALAVQVAKAQAAAAMAAPAVQAQRRTVGDALDTWVADYLTRRYRTDGAVKESAAMLRAMLAPLASVPMAKLHRRDVIPLLAAKNRTHANTARKSLALAKQFTGWCTNIGLIEHDPLAGATAARIGLEQYEPRERILSDEELRGLWNDWPAQPYGNLLQFCVLTGCRIGEAIAFEPEQLVQGLWTIPETKSGRVHALPLAPAALALAGTWPARKYISVWNAIQAKGVGWNLHDLRRSAASRMREAGVSAEAVESVLNHAVPRLQRTYQRHDPLAARGAALQALEVAVLAVVG